MNLHHFTVLYSIGQFLRYETHLMTWNILVSLICSEFRITGECCLLGCYAVWLL
jgi:hypothetical protein